MSPDTCRLEREVVDAARHGEWSEDLRAHLRQCSDCAESARVGAFMAGVAQTLRRDRPVSSDYIWWKAEFERRAAEVRPASWRRPGTLALGLAFALAGTAAVLAAWPELSALASTARGFVATVLADTPPVEMTVIVTAWLGLPLLLGATHLIVFRSAH